MASIEYWIQLENRPWDVSPHNIDRMTGQKIKDHANEGKPPVTGVVLFSPGTGVTRKTTMYRPLRDDAGMVTDALILRRYKPPQKADGSDAWTVPDDRKVNPWDLNELDPTDGGTMGTIPGPTIECSVGDDVRVHFRNRDMRSTPSKHPHQRGVPYPVEQRTHSLHPHGFVFAPQSDGAFPLSPPDVSQAISPDPADHEHQAWALLNVSGSKQGDRVPPGGTFIYHWNTFGWQTTAGVWLYHDHSICDMESTGLGAIGMIVIHNSADVNGEVDIRLPEAQQDATGTALDPAFLPGGSATDSPLQVTCFPLPGGFPTHVLPHDLVGLGRVAAMPHEDAGATAGPGMAVGMGGEAGMAAAAGIDEVAKVGGAMETKPVPSRPVARKRGHAAANEVGPAVPERLLTRGDLMFELDPALTHLARLCTFTYVPPPSKALYLQLYHSAGDAGVCVNGRKYLGNTPTMIAGQHTRMRFGVVGMGSEFHTFHIHGHRWTIPGPHGNNPGEIQGSVLDTPVSQFEDTRTFGPANSFVFTIEEGNGFMRADPFTPGSPLGEWHMHCHVLMHMDQGMMGSLLIIDAAGGPAFGLPQGRPCKMVMPTDGGGGPPGGGGAPMTASVKDVVGCKWRDDASGTAETTVKVGGTVTWHDTGACPGGHTVTSDNGPAFDLALSGGSASKTFTAVGDFGYHCNVHGGDPVAKTGMWGIVHVVVA